MQIENKGLYFLFCGQRNFYYLCTRNHKTIKDMAKKWKVSYVEKSDDLTNVWVYADTVNDAIREVESEYWDVKKILMCFLYKYKDYGFDKGLHSS